MAPRGLAVHFPPMPNNPPAWAVCAADQVLAALIAKACIKYGPGAFPRDLVPLLALIIWNEHNQQGHRDHPCGRPTP